MDYRKYRAGFAEKLACAAVGAGAAGMAAWLFYRSVWGMLLFPAVYLVCVKEKMHGERRRGNFWNYMERGDLWRQRCDG